VPGIAFASDFIVGFPGETEADFRATLELVERERFQQIFAFRYSPRPGTRAAALTDDVPREEKERRLQALLAAQERVNAERNAAAVGTEATVLVEGLSKQDESKLVGRTPQTQLVVFPAPAAAEGREALIGEEVRLRIVDQTPLTLFGERLAP
jgi:tRNA-2-methylthio-N6-dimethylallyladenosine synthase